MHLFSLLSRKPRRTPSCSNSLRKRRLTVESLESKRLLALVGVDPGFPLISYDSTGTMNYDSAAQTLDLVATPLAFKETELADPAPVELPGAVAIHLQVDNAGNLIGGVPGDDLLVTGTINSGSVNVSGVLLTGEVTAFGFAEGGATDVYDFRFVVTGGALASYFFGKEIGVTTTSENSTFGGSFTVSFEGGAKGNIGTVDIPTGCLSGHKFKDRTGDGLTNDDIPLGGTKIELFQDVDGNEQYDPLIDGPAVATTTTAAGTGAYSFGNLPPGKYLVREVVPPGYQQTAPNGGYYAVTVVAGAVVEDLDFANFKEHDCPPKWKHHHKPKCHRHDDPPKPPCDPHYNPPKPPCDPPGEHGPKHPGPGKGPHGRGGPHDDCPPAQTGSARNARYR